MVKYRLDCYTQLKENGWRPALVLWFNTKAKAIKVGADFCEHYSGSGAWFGVTQVGEAEFFLKVLESAYAKTQLRGKRE